VTKPICIYHGGCVDGFTAAWAVWRALGEIDFHPGIYGEAPPDVTGRDVIMVDFSYKRPVIDTMAATCRTMLILDHHKTAAADLARIERPYVENMGWEAYLDSVHNAFHQLDRDPRAPFAIFDMERSGAQIAWDFFHTAAHPRPTLVDYVADRDLWRFNLEFSREVSAYIYSWPMDFDQWTRTALKLDASERDFQDVFLSGAAILRQHDRNVASVIRNTRQTMVIGGQRVPVANCPHFMGSEAGHMLGEDQPFAATYYDREGGRVFSLRSREGGADVAAIAAQYGGGGHYHAAGFKAAPGWNGDE
jgi:hypothetical protein